MTRTANPLLNVSSLEAPFIWRHGAAISAGTFLRQVGAVARQLPDAPYAINLCEDRYHFLLVFAAMLLRGQVNLLPANRSAGEVKSVSARYGHCPCIVDVHQEGLEPLQHVLVLSEADERVGTPENPVFDPQQVCAVVFTSGSTGESQPWEKRWGELYAGAQITQRMLDLETEGMGVVATVPSQHMYGLETTIMLPLVTGMGLDGGRPFFPNDLQEALSAVPEPRLLVTTPVHLNACLEAGLHWPSVSRIISATAPLSRELAERAEEAFSAPLYEIYGSTETGAIATRRTRYDKAWRPHSGLTLRVDSNMGEECVTVQGGHLAGAVALNDRVQLNADGRFELLGRNSDMLKIAGKRVSLADLNHRLLGIPGVEDGVFCEAEERGQGVSRLCAVVVAPSLSRGEIIAALKAQVDPVCLPRPLYLVDRLPRNDAGKLPRKALLELLAKLREN